MTVHVTQKFNYNIIKLPYDLEFYVVILLYFIQINKELSACARNLYYFDQDIRQRKVHKIIILMFEVIFHIYNGTHY